MKTIGVYTKDFSLYYDIISVLKRRKISFVSLSSTDHIPHGVGVLITSNREIHDIKHQKIIAADAYDSIDHAIDLALQLLIGKELYSKVFIGIDPGEKPGIAVVGDDILLQKTNADSPEKTVSIVKRLLREYPANEILVRIGHGSIINRNRIINSLISLDIPIEIVDETKTTASQQVSRSERDREAAAAIALISGGGRIQSRLPFKVTRGDIKNVQKRSRQLTGGRFSISEKTALMVLEGKLSLKEAVEIEKAKKPKRL